MRTLLNWNSFYETILEKNIVDKNDKLPEPKEFTLKYPNDKNWRYTFKNGNWYARALSRKGDIGTSFHSMPPD